jgi:hypothetical protein
MIKKDYAKKAVAVKAAAAGCAGKKKKGGGKGAAAAKLKLPKHHMEQGEAKLYLPPDCAIWKSNTRAQWCGHVQGYKRCSECFASHGDSSLALLTLLQRMWTQHLDKIGGTQADCPIIDLF